MNYNTKKNLSEMQMRGEFTTQDLGLRTFMQAVYNYMSMALLLTGVFAYLGGTNQAIIQMLYQVNADGQMLGMTGLGWIVAFAPLGFVMFLSAGLHRLSLQTTQLLFWSYAAIMGLSLSSLFMLFTGESIARVFFITAAVFGGMSIYGHTTKRDLTSMGSFLMMGLFGLILVSLVNVFFLKSTGVEFATSLLFTMVFIGLTAYDTQSIKMTYYESMGQGEIVTKLAIQGALRLYLDYINIFMQLMRFFGDRRN